LKKHLYRARFVGLTKGQKKGEGAEVCDWQKGTRRGGWKTSRGEGPITKEVGGKAMVPSTPGKQNGRGEQARGRGRRR